MIKVSKVLYVCVIVCFIIYRNINFIFKRKMLMKNELEFFYYLL